MQDTLDGFGVREPLMVRDFGTVFWSPSYCSAPFQTTGEGSFPTFGAFLAQTCWTTHYAIPSYGGCTLVLTLSAPLRTEGFENADICVDRLMGTMKRSYTRDWEKVPVTSLSIPQVLIERLERLLLEWLGERLMVHYCCLPEEGDPSTILVEFSGCQRLLTDPDETLRYIAKRLSGDQ